MYHSHIVANSVSFVDGMMFRSEHVDMQGFCDHVADVTGGKTVLFFAKTKK